MNLGRGRVRTSDPSGLDRYSAMAHTQQGSFSHSALRRLSASRKTYASTLGSSRRAKTIYQQIDIGRAKNVEWLAT